ncbi:MAG TPA: hypothetical protein VEY09_04050 [Pyrinomonadaceae bacterium]|nr:hypothetical protein [Pyrinomonadaceae bacterium]
MKFMIINTPNGQNYSETSPSSTVDVTQLQTLLDSGTVEVAYSTVAGGHIYVVTAESTEELVRLVRGNPFFHDSHTEVIPLMDAVDFLRGVSDALGAEPSSHSGD